MRVGIPRETTQGERRVALVPETVGKLAAQGFELVVEQAAGDAASFPDDAYTEAGATLGDPWEADGVVKVRKPSAEDARRIELSLTPAGRRMLARCPEPTQARLLGALRRMGAAPLDALTLGLGALVREMGIDQSAPHMFFEESPAAKATAAPRTERPSRDTR